MNVNLNLETTATAKWPAYKTIYSAGMDVYADLPGCPIYIEPGDRKLIPTGLFFRIDGPYYLELFPRSGNSLRLGIDLANGVGVIDSDYRDEVKAIVRNMSDHPVTIDHQSAIGQLIVKQRMQATINGSSIVEQKERNGGFGSTDLEIEPGSTPAQMQLKEFSF